MTCVHVFASATAQDNNTVLVILDEVFSQLKTVMPELQTTSIIAPQIARRHGLQISRIDFSEPQGGKGACDRKAATA